MSGDEQDWTRGREPHGNGFVRAAVERERARVAALLTRDRRDARAERLRATAVVEVEQGRLVNIGDTAIGPTPEQLGKAEFRPYTAEGRKGTVRSVKAMRRVEVDRLVELHQRGVLDDDLFAACAWYRRAYETAGLGTVLSAGSMAPTIRGSTTSWDHLPRGTVANEAWDDYRYARDGISADARPLFDLVVLDNVALADAAKLAQCRFAAVSAAFRRGALDLFERISHRLPIR